MKTNSFIALPLTLLMCLSGCKTLESGEPALEGKRMEIEAITMKYSELSLRDVPMDWAKFSEFVNNDAIVEHLNLEKYEECLRSTINHSNKVLTLNKESGCNDLHSHMDKMSYQEYQDFKERNRDAFARCDSLSQALLEELDSAIAPCRDIFGPVGEEASATTGKRRKR